MRRGFRLATLERLRAARLDDAARDLGLARQEVVAALARHDAVATELAGCVAAGTVAAELEAAQARRGLLRERLAETAAAVDAARERAAAAVGSWTAARAGLKAVQTLHDRHREALLADDARREQRLVDDLAGSRRRLLGLPEGA